MPEWYCHQCNKKVVPVSQHTEPTCPFCMQTFVEQLEDDHIDTVADDDMYGTTTTFSNTSTPTTSNPTSPFFQMPRQQPQATSPHAQQQLDLNAMMQQIFGMPSPQPQQQPQAQNQQQQQQRRPRNFLECVTKLLGSNNNY